jgi:hypothetical protein
MALLAAIGTAAVVFGTAVLFGGSPPPQPPFPYVSPGESLGSFSTTVGDCGKAGAAIPVFAARRPGLLPVASVGYVPWTGPTIKRPRLYLAKRRSQTIGWVRLLDATQPGQGIRSNELGNVDFRRCAVLAVFVPGNVDEGFLGIRLNDPKTLTVGLFQQPHPRQLCATTTTTSGGTTTSCVDEPPIDGSALLFALQAKTVARVRRVYGVTQAPPPPNTTTTGLATTG